MDFDLSKPQKLLKQSARDFLARECKSERVRAAMATDTADDRALFSAAADQGWTALIIPETYGGLGLGIVDLAVVAEEMGRACMPGPLFATIFASAALVREGTEEQKRRWLEPIAAGEMRATVALGNEFVLDAGVSDLILRFTDDGVEEVEGVTATRTPSMDETRKVYRIEDGHPSSAFGTFSPRGVEKGARAALSSIAPLPACGERVPKAGEGPIDVATVALCAEMVGGMQWILDTTVEYAKTRQQFGRVIGSFQAVQHLCADMLLFTESARSATYYAAWALTEDDPGAALATSIAKAYCSDAYREVANRGVQVHGGIGFTWEHDLQIYYKRGKASETMFGDATFHRERIAGLVVGQPVEVNAETMTS
jgi:alkylation response protein AidB-like acyl-CoA dehydrogenase